MDDSNDFGGFHPPRVGYLAGDLCPRCGDLCDVDGGCATCERLSRAIATGAAIDRNEHLNLIAGVVRHARALA